MTRPVEETKLLYTMFRCDSGHKATIGPDYEVQVGAYPETCQIPVPVEPNSEETVPCGAGWRSVEPVYESLPGGTGY